MPCLAAMANGDATIDGLAEFAVLSGAVFTGQSTLVDEHLERMDARWNGRPLFSAWNTVSRGLKAILNEQFEAAVVFGVQARALAESSGNPNMVAWATSLEGGARSAVRNPSAVEVLSGGLDLANQSGSVLAAQSCRDGLLAELITTGRYHDALPLIIESLAGTRGRAAWVHRNLVSAVTVLAGIGRTEQAATLFGAIDQTSLLSSSMWRTWIQRARQLLVADLGDEQVDELIAAANHLTLQEAVEFADAALRAEDRSIPSILADSRRPAHT